jgi:nitric oxide reductase subunit B
MTEWIIFIHIIYNWAKSLSKETKKKNLLTYRFLMASEFWVFINLVLALLMSIPTLNYYMHGTHITVAHSMGTTIGINTTILLASVIYIIKNIGPKEEVESKTMKYGFVLFNISLMLFWLSLLIGGVYKAIWMSNPENTVFSQLHESTNGVFLIFIITGGLLFSSLLMIALPLLRRLYRFYILKTQW